MALDIDIVDELLSIAHQEQLKELNRLKFEEENPDPRGLRQEVSPGPDQSGPAAIKLKFAIKRDPNEIVGYSMMVYQNPKSELHAFPPGMAFISGYVRQDLRHNGIGALLFDETIEMAKEETMNRLLFNTIVDTGTSFLTSRGAQIQSQHLEQRLYINNLDNKLIDKWQAISLPEGYIVELLENIPDEDIESFCEFYTMLSNNITREHNDGVEFKRVITPKERRQEEQLLSNTNNRWYTLIIRNLNHEIVGLTEMIYDPTMEYAIRQNLTGVKPGERGKGLGKILKATMIANVTEFHPKIEFIYTTNDMTNNPMRGINNTLGFTPYNTVYAIGLDLG